MNKDTEIEEIRQPERLLFYTELIIEHTGSIIKSLTGRPLSKKERKIREFYKDIQEKLLDHLDY